jgi:anti-anti-sigma factor
MTVRSAEAGDSGPATAEVVLSGELDIATLDDAQRQIEAAEVDAPALLVIDLSGLTFVDSSGVRLALLAHDRARAAGRRIAICLGTGHALRVFQALGLLDKLEILPPKPGDAPTDRAAPA